ncbi:MAG: hypothetical protein UZ07_CHB004001721 [Chlorobi bacterium OLB7]|nr:MAG: hypothetical protein UZ07_CHB004001721 [Chlorobi bacterium OLB7]
MDLSATTNIAAFNDVNLWVGNTDGAAKELRLYENNSSLTYGGANYAALKAAATMAANTTYTLPNAAPTSNGQMLVSTTGGTMSWGIKLTKATVTVDVGSVGAGASLTQTFTVTGAATGAIAAISPASALPDGLIISYVRVSAANTVELKFFNATASAIDPASMDWNIIVAE